MAASGAAHLIVKHGSKLLLNECTDMTRTEAAVISTVLGCFAGTITGVLTGALTAGADPVAGIGMAIVDAIFDPDLFWNDVADSSSTGDVRFGDRWEGVDPYNNRVGADSAGADDVHFGAHYNGVDRFGRPVEADGFGEPIPRYSDTQQPVPPTTVTWNTEPPPAAEPPPPPAPEPPAASAA